MFYDNNFSMMSGSIPWGTPWFLLVIAWTLFWKGLAMWHAAHRKDKVWFVVFLVVNLVGIPEILYLFLVAKPKNWKLS